MGENGVFCIILFSELANFLRLKRRLKDIYHFCRKIRQPFALSTALCFEKIYPNSFAFLLKIFDMNIPLETLVLNICDTSS